MKGRRRFLVPLFGAVLLAGLVMGCGDLFHPEGPGEYVVTFDLDGGNISGKTATVKVSVNSGDSVGDKMPSNPSRSGYTFGNWYTEKNGEGNRFYNSTTVDKDRTVYAKWTANTGTECTVTFDLQGGKAGNGSSTNPTRTVNSGSSIGASYMPSNPSREGYTFDGWYTASNGGGSPFNGSTTVTATRTVYAKWTAIGSTTQYTVTFNLQGGTIDGSTAQVTQTVNSGDSVGVDNMPSDPSRDNYTFGGWYTATNGGGSQFYYNTVVTVNRPVYAYWIEGVKYELTQNPVTDTAYSLNLDTFLPSGFTVTEGEQITISFSVKTDTTMTNFYIGIGDWNNSGYAGYSGNGWIAPGWGNKMTVSADGQFHSYTWALTATKDAPVGPNPLVFQFSADRVSADKITVYVKDVVITQNSDVLPNTLAEWLEAISSNVVDGGAYTYTLKSNETIAPQSLFYNGKNVSIALDGGSTERTVSLGSNGSLFTVESGVTLTLGNNVTLQGRSSNTASLVYVNSGGTLAMENGSKITGNMNYVYSANDYAYVYGSGVYVSGGTLTMDGGEISGNTAYAESASSYAGVWGGGVHIGGGTFTLNSGKISGNTAKISGYSGSFIDGAGIQMNTVDFTMNGGEISGNTVVSSQGNGSFAGGGIYFCYGTLTMNGGEITGNGSSVLPGSGGGVFFGYENDTFIMTGGTISGNSAEYGGGVYVWNDSTFTKQSGGTIYGSNASSTLKNTATSGDDYGHAVYVNSSPSKLRNSTASYGVTLDSGVSGSAGGWEVSYDLTLAAWLDEISANAVEGGNYTYTLNNDEDIEPTTLYYYGLNVSITLDGGSTERTVRLGSTGSLFTVESGVTLTLGNNVTLHGRDDNTASLVRVNDGGTLMMNNNSKISGNKNTAESSYGGGVHIAGGAALTMNGGTISDNESASNGAGVYATSNSVFTMTSGTISRNESASSNGGGGVYMNGTFTMSDGIINGNTANRGGGVYVNSVFTMNGGEISGNESASHGGGVYVAGNGTFTKSGGTIYGSNASSTLKNTTIDGNGQAVYISGGSKLRNSTAGYDVSLNSGTDDNWEALNGVNIQLRPDLTASSPSLSSVPISVNETAYFSTDSGYASYKWYWNGALINGATDSTYIMAAHLRTPGIYELSVVITTSEGKKLSAQCRVVINAN
jgi:uncharacterized repeat protein (TIGR02543 family)